MSHILRGATPEVKSIAYRCVVRPLLEYGCHLWNPFTNKDIHLLENIQHCAARWVYDSRWNPSVFAWTKSSDKCLEELGWPSLKTCCNYISICLLYDIIYIGVMVS